jgi:hypothetical protein
MVIFSAPATTAIEAVPLRYAPAPFFLSIAIQSGALSVPTSVGVGR